jgi:hypothetical protein
MELMAALTSAMRATALLVGMTRPVLVGFATRLEAAGAAAEAGAAAGAAAGAGAEA